MSFKESLYGSKNPALRKVILINLMIGLPILTIYGMIFGNLVVNERLWEFLKISSIFLSIIFSISFAYIILSYPNKREALRRQLEKSNKYCKYKIIRLFCYILLIPLSGVLFALFLCGSIYGTCDIHTKIFGEKYGTLAILHKVHKRHRKSCDYYFSGSFFERMPKGKICLDYEVFVTLPEGNIKVNLYGKKSIFGVVVTEWEINNS